MVHTVTPLLWRVNLLVMDAVTSPYTFEATCKDCQKSLYGFVILKWVWPVTPCSLVQTDQDTVSIFSLYHAARRHAPEDRSINTPCCENTEYTEFCNGCAMKVGRSEDFSNSLWWRVIEDLHLLLLLIGGGGVTHEIGWRSSIAMLWHVCVRAACFAAALRLVLAFRTGQMSPSCAPVAVSPLFLSTIAYVLTFLHEYIIFIARDTSADTQFLSLWHTASPWPRITLWFPTL